MNEYICLKIFEYIRIFEYSSHPGIWWFLVVLGGSWCYKVLRKEGLQHTRRKNKKDYNIEKENKRKKVSKDSF